MRIFIKIIVGLLLLGPAIFITGFFTGVVSALLRISLHWDLEQMHYAVPIIGGYLFGACLLGIVLFLRTWPPNKNAKPDSRSFTTIDRP